MPAPPRPRAALSLTAKSMFVAVAVGALAWGVTDHFAARDAKRVFEAHLGTQLSQRAVDYRYLFGRSIYTYREAVKVLAGQRNFLDYLDARDWRPGEAPPTRHERRPPAWLASASVLRSLCNPRYALLLDPWGSVREIFTSAGDDPPRFLLPPQGRLLALSEEESYLVSDEGRRFVIATKTVGGRSGSVAGRLIIASPIDEEFLRAAYGSSMQGMIMAIVDESTHVILASSTPGSIQPGKRAEDYSGGFLVTLQEYFEYGSSEMDFLVASFVSREAIAPESRSFIRDDRVRRGFQAGLIIAALSIIVFVIARRIERLSDRVRDFSREALGIRPPDALAGDQIAVLEGRFRLLTEEVVASHKTIREDAVEKERRSAEIERKERQLTLLQSVTDAMGVGVMLETERGYVPSNSRMRSLEETFRDLAVFAAGEQRDEERVLRAPDGRRFVFFIATPPIPMDEKVVLVSDVTEKKEAADRLRLSYETQRVVNNILLLAFEPVPLDEQLVRALDHVLTLPWLRHWGRGIIFRYHPESETLELVAGRQISAEQLRVCRTVRSGTCVCGRAAASRKTVFTNVCEDLHEIHIADIPPHGHYCVPITSGALLHGVMSLYLEPDHERNAVEEEQLQAIASAIASIFGLSRVEAEKKALFGQLLQAQKMETVGRLAGGVAHDFNNILTVILGYTDMTLHELGEDHPLVKYLQTVLEACERAQGLTSQLLAFSRSQVLEMRVASLNDIVLSAARILRRLVGEDIAIEIETAPEVPNVLVDPVQIEQILFNLVVNARDAMPGAGKIVVKTGAAEIAPGATPPRPPPAPGPGTYAVLHVSDTGSGMPADVQERIFEPFFTTKETGKGTGLGLATVYGIVAQHNGGIEVHSEVGSGTDFQVFLPVTERPLPAGASVVDAHPVGGSETLLVVEDDDVVRRLFVSFLAPLGYRILTASSGEEALGVSMFHPGRIDLLVTDVVMPGVTGRELSAALRSQRPETRTLFISGYTRDAQISETLKEEHSHFLQKPVTPARLAEKIRSILDAPANPGAPPPEAGADA